MSVLGIGTVVGAEPYLARPGSVPGGVPHYWFDDDGTSLTIQTALNPAPVRRMDHRSNTGTVHADQVFNRGIKRGDTILVTGDKPRFALARTLPEAKMDPDIHKLGDGRIRIRCGGAEFWLDECDAIQTTFRPSRTEYVLKTAKVEGLAISLWVSQAADWGFVARLTVSNAGPASLELSAEFLYGGLSTHGRTFSAAYFKAQDQDAAGNAVELDETMGRVSNKLFKVFAAMTPPVKPANVNGRLSFVSALALPPGASRSVALCGGWAIPDRDIEKEVRTAQPQALIDESAAYYAAMLDRAVISTPSRVLDSGFRNAFLYQADHLGLPGAAASPSLMMAGMLERWSRIADEVGQKEQAQQWRDRAARTEEAIRKTLWNPDAGCFYSHVDNEKIPHMAHYYTDHVFPTLYSRQPEEYGWSSLRYLRSSLCFETGADNPLNQPLLLMRVGNLKPTVFGNDNVMPVQMAEAARAYFRAGDFETGARMLDAVALTGTVFTEAPGNFPERMGDDGKGEANYLFGNPIGSFLYGVVDGLFGLSLAERGQTVRWQPGFPDAWNHAELRLPYAQVRFNREAGAVTRCRYVVTTPEPRKLDLMVQLPPSRLRGATLNGREVKVLTIAGLNRVRVAVSGPAAMSHEVLLEFEPVPVSAPVAATGATGARVGSVLLTYADGRTGTTDLVVDGNLKVKSWERGGGDVTVACDPGTPLKEIAIRLVAADVQLGVTEVVVVACEETETREKLSFIGGFDQNAGFERWTPEATRRLVHECFEATRDHAGYIVSPSDHFFHGDPARLHALAAVARECVY